MPREYNLRLPILIFGDGLQGQLFDITEGFIDEDGVTMVEIRLRPTQELASRMKIPMETLDPHDNTLLMRYPKSKVMVLNSDPSTGAVLIFCDFYGRETRLTQLHIDLLNAVEGQEKVIFSLRGENAYLHEQLTRMGSADEMHTTETVRRLKPILAMRGQLDNIESGQDQSDKIEYPGP